MKKGRMGGYEGCFRVVGFLQEKQGSPVRTKSRSSVFAEEGNYFVQFWQF